MRAALVALLLSSLAFAGSSRISRGDLLKQRQYRTAGDLVFYVDPTGSDANACTATGVNACLTIQGALNKAPKLLRHQVTVNVAAGNYAGAIVSGFTVDPSVQQATAGILINGVMANVTPATGTATGTASSGSLGSATAPGTLVDNTQTWTTNDPALVGHFISITGGTGAGQVGVITSNTATTLTVPTYWTGFVAPAAGSTYAIQSPSSKITSAATAIPLAESGVATPTAGLILADNNVGSSSITIQNVDVTFAGATSGVVIHDSGSVRLTQDYISVGNASPVISFGLADQVSLATVSTTSASAIYTTGAWGISSSRVKSTAAGMYVSSSLTAPAGGGAYVAFSEIVAPYGVIAYMAGAVSVSTSRCDCSSVADSACLTVGFPGVSGSASAGPVGHATGYVIGLDVTNCSYGLMATSAGTITVNKGTVLSGNALTYAVNATHGGTITLSTSTATITGATAQVSIDDGLFTDSFAGLTAVGNCIVNLALGSKVCRL